MTAKRMYVGGEWIESQSGDVRSILNPFNGKELTQVTEGGTVDAVAAIAAAREAFDKGPWPQTTPAERASKIRTLADAILLHKEDLAALETMDTGKTLEESRWDIDDVADVFRYYAELALDIKEESLKAPQADAHSRLVSEPAGVCGQILPWNYPLLQASWKLAPALAAGCTVVMKPSEITPLTTLRLTGLAEEVGFPKGVINTVLGPGATVGAALAQSGDVDLVSFTGGVQTGKAVMAAASETVKRVALELGGKNPNIVFADANLEVAVDQAMNAVFFHAGQICSAGTRLMLHADIHDAFVEALVERMKGIRLGSGLEAKTQMGPLISKEHREKVEAHVQGALGEGAVLRMGGKRPLSPELQAGYFFEPTLFTDCHDGMAMVREEVFGPVISVERFSDEDEVIRRANDTIYGLSAGVWTTDQARMERMSRALRFGTVWINDYNVYFAQAPWGGFKQSGIGRELGRAGLHEYLETKHIYRNPRPQKVGFFGATS
jgi:betaine-aldehyde dehydrogenase